MKTDELIAAFETLAEAPDGVARLRELVLQLAVRGKLVPQEPGDEPASVLLERIGEEKARLVKAKKISKPKPLPPVSDCEVPFDVPEGWHWARFSEVANIASNLVNPNGYQSVPHLAPDNIEKGTGRLLRCRTIAEDGVTSAKHRFFPGQIVYSKIRPNLSKVVAVDFDGLCSADMYPIDPWLDRGFLLTFMLSQPFLFQVTSDDNRLAMPKVNQEQLSVVLVTVPPLPEQHRIVAKVDELMGLLDRLEAARNAREAARTAFRDSALQSLREAASPEEVEAAWSRVATRMDDLFTAPADVEPLRQTILQLAVRGKLVPQDPKDQPATLGLHGRKGKTDSESLAHLHDGFPFMLPRGWVAVRFGDVFSHIFTGPFGTSLKAAEYVKGGTPVINPQNMRNGTIFPTEDTCVGPATLGRLSNFRVVEHDIVVARRGEMGRCVVVGATESGWLCGTGSLVLRPPADLSSKFVALFVRNPWTVTRLAGDSVGSTMANLNQRIMVNLPFGLPPLAEQHRIVAKVDELMSLVDRLQEGLRAVQATQAAFAAAAVHHLDV